MTSNASPGASGTAPRTSPVGPEGIDELAVLREQLQAALARIDALESATRPPVAVTRPINDGSLTDGPVAVDRRGFLGRAAVAAGGAAVGAVAASAGAASPAAAADGAAVTIGAVNGGSTRTVLLVPGTAEYGFGVHEGNLAEFPTDGAIAGAATTAFSAGVVGHGAGEKIGVYGGTEDGQGVQAFAVSGTGVVASSQTGTAIRALGGNGSTSSAVYATCDAPHTSGNGTIVAVSGEGTGLVTIGRRSLHLFPRADGGNPHPPAAGAPSSPGALAVGAPGGNTSSTLWFCTNGGTPGTWRKLAGPDTAGSFHILGSTVRVYDSRNGNLPNVGTKAPLTNAATRVVDCKQGGAVPAGATAVLLNLTIVNTTLSGYLALFKNGISWPGNSTINWGQPGTVLANSAVVALDDQARFLAKASPTGGADFIVDVIGYYR